MSSSGSIYDYRPYAQDGGNDPDGVVNTPSGASTPGAGRSRSGLQLGFFPTRRGKTTRTTKKDATTAMKHQPLWWSEGGPAVAAAAKKQAIATPFAFVAPAGEVPSEISGRRLELGASIRSLEGC